MLVAILTVIALILKIIRLNEGLWIDEIAWNIIKGKFRA